MASTSRAWIVGSEWAATIRSAKDGPLSGRATSALWCCESAGIAIPPPRSRSCELNLGTLETPRSSYYLRAANRACGCRFTVPALTSHDVRQGSSARHGAPPPLLPHQTPLPQRSAERGDEHLPRSGSPRRHYPGGDHNSAPLPAAVRPVPRRTGHRTRFLETHAPGTRSPPGSFLTSSTAAGGERYRARTSCRSRTASRTAGQISQAASHRSHHSRGQENPFARTPPTLRQWLLNERSRDRAQPGE